MFSPSCTWFKTVELMLAPKKANVPPQAESKALQPKAKFPETAQ